MQNEDSGILIIPCAGIGERLRPITYQTPKSLIEFGGESLLESLLKAFANEGIKEAVIIVGHFSDAIKKKIGKKFEGMNIKFIYNPFYSISRQGHSVWLARKYFENRIAYHVDGDLLLDERLVKMLVRSKYRNCLLVDGTVNIPYLTEEAVVVGQNSIVKCIAWDEEGQALWKQKIPNIVGESVGVIKLSPEASTAYSYELDRFLREGKNSAYLEAISAICLKFDIWYLSTNGLPWIEIDYPADLERARSEIYTKILSRKK